MKEPTAAQMRSLYRHSYQLTELFSQPIHMVRIDFNKMTDHELKRYMLEHRDNTGAFYAYMDRRHARSKKVLITAEEAKLPFEEYMKLSEERMRAQFGDTLQPKQPPTVDK